MASNSSSSPGPKSSAGSGRKRTSHVIGAVAGAVLGGVLGAIVVKKVRDGSAKRLVPAKVPPLAKRAAGAVKSLAHDAKVVAKATAVVAADAALEQVSKAAQQFMVDVASGHTPKPPERFAPTDEATKTPAADSQPPAPAGESTEPKSSTVPATAPAAATKQSTAARKRAPKKSAKSSKPTAKPKAR